MRSFGWLLITMGLFAAGTLAAADKPAPVTDGRSAFESADTNKDGRIDRMEYFGRLTDAFFIIDANRDGHLTLDEIKRQVPDADPARIKAADTNRDGTLSLDEYLRALDQDLDAFDRNADGALEWEEVKLWFAPLR